MPPLDTLILEFRLPPTGGIPIARRRPSRIAAKHPFPRDDDARGPARHSPQAEAPLNRTAPTVPRKPSDAHTPEYPQSDENAETDRSATCRWVKTDGIRISPRSRAEMTASGVLDMKKVFTTGQVAKICKVAPRTVSKWFDSGRLRGYRIPGSQDRRIPREHLLRFLKEHGMPLGELEAEVFHKVLVVGAEPALMAGLQDQLRESDNFRLEAAASGFEAGIRAESFHPDCIIIDLAVGRIEAGQIAQNLRKSEDHISTILVALTSDDPGPELAELGFNDSFKKPFDAALLAERIKRLIQSKKESEL